MSQQELLKTVIKQLNQSGIEYMVTGSMVSSLQGEPRATHDIDLVIALQQADVDKLISSFPSSLYYLDEEAMKNAVSHQTSFNLIHLEEGTKVDFWILTDEPFDRSRFSRRYVESVFGIEVQVSSPEDTILAKLRWFVLSGGSEKQFTDALRVFEIQYNGLDLKYLETWMTKLNLKNLWQRLKEKAEIL